jgi:hypothetical protein
VYYGGTEGPTTNTCGAWGPHAGADFEVLARHTALQVDRV